MATLTEIKKVIERGEGHTVEFKKKTVNVEKMVKELLSFANTDGGNLFIGISDDGEIAGLKNPEEDLFVLKNAIVKHAVPSFRYETEIVAINSKRSLVRVWVPSSRKKPHYFRPEPGIKGEAYIRIEDECVKASREMTAIMKLRRIKKGQFLQIGENEQRILSLFSAHKGLTVSMISQLLKSGRRATANTLVGLTASGVLNIIPVPGKEDIFIQN